MNTRSSIPETLRDIPGGNELIAAAEAPPGTPLLDALYKNIDATKSVVFKRTGNPTAIPETRKDAAHFEKEDELRFARMANNWANTTRSHYRPRTKYRSRTKPRRHYKRKRSMRYVPKRKYKRRARRRRRY